MKAHNDHIESRTSTRVKEANLLSLLEESEKRNRKIEKKYRFEKQLREEITRTCQCATADIHLIKAKISDQEFAVIQQFKTLIDKDRQRKHLEFIELFYNKNMNILFASKGWHLNQLN